MVRRTGQQGVPVIAVGDQYIVGFDRARLEQALATYKPDRPLFGAAIADAAHVATRRTAATRGAYVGRVTADSPAARAGIAAGDVIVGLGGRNVASANELEAALATIKPGAPFIVTFLRGGDRHSAEVRL